MVANRQDAWTPEDDLLLAEVVLRHIREGSTQLAAFEEVAERLGRTPAACGFRWNSTVRKRYEEAIAQAKSIRQKKKYAKTKSETGNANLSTTVSQGESEESGPGIEEVIRFLKNQQNKVRDLLQQIDRLQEENLSKDEEIRKLKEENERIKKEFISIESIDEDYRTLVQIMERARKMAMLKDQLHHHGEKPVFKLDANGNLERVNK